MRLPTFSTLFLSRTDVIISVVCWNFSPIDWLTYFNLSDSLFFYLFPNFRSQCADVCSCVANVYPQCADLCSHSANRDLFRQRTCLLYAIRDFILWIQDVFSMDTIHPSMTQIAWFGIHLICKHALQILLWEAVKSAISINRHCRYKSVISSAYSSVLCLKMPVWVNVLLPSFLHIYFFSIAYNYQYDDNL